jgi:hypothetical protein
MGECSKANRSCVMPIFNIIAKPAAVALTLFAVGCMAATAQAQPAKRVVVAMAPSDVSVAAAPATPRMSARAASAPRAKHYASASSAKTVKPDCFWCNRTVYISGMTY